MSIDEDECEREKGGCVHTCVNTLGSYTCSCLPGFMLHKDNHNCIGQYHTTMSPFQSSYSYFSTTDMFSVPDGNECFHERGGCEHQCINTLGSYSCRCNAGYSLNQDENTCTRE